VLRGKHSFTLSGRLGLAILPSCKDELNLGEFSDIASPNIWRFEGFQARPHVGDGLLSFLPSGMGSLYQSCNRAAESVIPTYQCTSRIVEKRYEMLEAIEETVVISNCLHSSVDLTKSTTSTPPLYSLSE